jgi:hypothetical protein
VRIWPYIVSAVPELLSFLYLISAMFDISPCCHKRLPREKYTITQICLSLSPVKPTGAGEGKYRLLRFSPPSSRGCPKTKPQNPQQISISIRIEAPCFCAIHSPLGPRIFTLFPAPPPLFDVCCLSSEGTPYPPQSSCSFSHSVRVCFVHGGNLTSSRCPAAVHPARS